MQAERVPLFTVLQLGLSDSDRGCQSLREVRRGQNSNHRHIVSVLSWRIETSLDTQLRCTVLKWTHDNRGN
jgi:uncharacterized membrane protein YcjF (UPF0283 family)